MVGVGEDAGAIFVSDLADENGLHPAAPSEAHVAAAVADHYRAGEVDVRVVGFGLHRQSRFGLAARTAAARQMGAHIYISDMEPVALQNIQQMAMHLVHIGLRAQPLGYALLVGDDEDFPKIIDNEWDGFQKILPQFQLRNILYIISNQLDIDNAITIQK